LDELEALSLENKRLRQDTGKASVPIQPPVLAYTNKVFCQFEETMYLSEPPWKTAKESSVALLVNNPTRNMVYYLDQDPGIAFAIYKRHDSITDAF
jgi:hypothetical protein